MALFLLIIQILAAIPSIIKIILAIIDMINKLPTGVEKQDAKLRLKGILQRIRERKSVSSEDSEELHKLMCDLEERSGSCEKE